MHKTLLAMLLAALITGNSAFGAELNAVPVNRNAETNLMAALPDFSSLVKQYGAAVVTVDVLQKPKAKVVATKKPYGKNEHTPAELSSGSGFILSPDGYIVTNAHVIENESDILVRLNDRREFSARVIGSDPKTDVALLKIDEDHLPAVKTGNIDELQVGEWVMAIGAPFGLDNTVTTGIVSTKSRHLSDAMTPFIQSSAISNPGNSGGPLFNLRGEVVGVNSRAALSVFGGNFGLSLAIPIDVVMQVVERLEKQGKAPSSRIGIALQDMNSRLAKALGLPHPEGQLISGVQKHSPAEVAGLQAGDYVVSFNGTPVRGNLPFLVGMTPQGHVSDIEVIRNGQSIRRSVIPQDMDSSPENEGKDKTIERREEEIRGMVLEAVAAEELQKLRQTFALRVKKSLHEEAKAGGFLIAIGQQPIKSFDDALKDLDTAEPRLLTIKLLGEDPEVLLRYVLIR